MPSLIDRFYPDDEDKKKKPSQVASEQQKTKTTLLDKYYPTKEKVEVAKVEEKKPSLFERVKNKASEVISSLTGKKKIEEQLAKTQAQVDIGTDTTQIRQPAIIKNNIFDDYIAREKTQSAQLTPEARAKSNKLVQPAIDTIQNMENRSKSLGTKDWKDRIYELATTGKDVPIAGNLVEIPEVVQLLAASDRLKKGTITKEDAVLLNDWLQQQNRDKTFGYKVLDTVIGSAKFGIEFALTGGAAAAGKEAAKKGIKYLMTKSGKKAIEQSLEKFGYKVAAGVVGETARAGVLSVVKTPKDVLERQLVSSLEAAAGVVETKENLGKSVTKSLLDQWTETVSERGGDAFGMLAKPLKDKLMKTALFQALNKLNPGKQNAITKLITKAGYNGVISEMAEERLGDVFRGMLYEVGLSDQEFKLPTPEQWAVEGISFLIPGVVAKVSDVVSTRLEDIGPNTIQLTPDAAIETVQMSDLRGTDAGNTIIANAYQAQKEGNMVLIDLDSKKGNIVVTPNNNNVGVSISKEQVIEKKEPTVTEKTSMTSPEALETKKKELLSKVSVGPQGETAVNETVSEKPVLSDTEISELKEIAKKSTDAKFFSEKIGKEKVAAIRESGETVVGFFNRANEVGKTEVSQRVDRLIEKERVLAGNMVGSQREAKLKAIGMEYSAIRRQIEGEPTNIEIDNAKKYLESMHRGKEVYISGKPAILTGKTSFGKSEVKFDNGATKFVSKNEIEQKEVTRKDIREYIKRKATEKLNERERLFKVTSERVSGRETVKVSNRPEQQIDIESEKSKILDYLSKRTTKLRTKEENKELIVQHNLSEENLLHAFKIGGLPVPSLAITKKAFPVESFGEITLLGDKELIKPSATSKVYGSDIYSPRYPTITYEPNKEAMSYLEDRLNVAKKLFGDDEVYSSYVYIEYFKDKGRKGIEESYATKQIFYAENNDNKPDGRGDVYDYAENNNREYQRLVDEIVNNIAGTEKIFMGYTYSGNRKYIAHNIENVVKIMKRDLVDNEGFNYGVGNVRANLAKKFKSIKEIQQNKNFLVPKDEMDSFKEYIEDKFGKVVDNAVSKYDGASGYPEGTFTQVLRDGIKSGNLKAELDTYGFSKANYKEISDFLTELKTAPTEYFEAKIKRSVDIGEFRAAIVPDTVSSETINLLKDKGLKIYKVGREENRADIVRRASESEGVLFRLADEFKKATGISLTDEQESKIIELNKKIFGDGDIRITGQILTPEGQKALGSYKDSMITILNGEANAVETFYHEAVHKYFDLFTTKEEQVDLLLEAKKRFGGNSYLEVEENLAENFIKYVNSRSGLTGKLKIIIDKIILRIEKYFDSEDKIKSIYSNIISGKAAVKKKSLSRKVNLAKNITQVKSALRSVRKKINELADEAEGMAEIAKEKREGLNTKNIAKLKRIYNRTRRFQEGDIETIRDSKWQSLVDGVIEDVQIKRPDLSEQEAFDYAIELPTKSEETTIKSEELIKLLNRQKILTGYLTKLELKANELSGQEAIKKGDEVYQEWKDAMDAQERLNRIITNQERLAAVQRPIEETMGEEKLSRVAERVLDKLIDVQREDIAYKPMNIVADAAKASEFVEQQPEMALRIAKGLELPPPDITETAISIAAAEKARQDGDYLLYTRLILSRTFRQTRRGQEIVAERGRMDENSSEFFIRKLLDERARIVASGKKWLFKKEVKVREVVAKEVKQIKNTIDTKVLRKLESAQKLIDSLTCKI